ncbi:hypothetical protein EKO24_006920 [Candidatus Methylobacter oryzae]|uniref:Uncharacterized protein n=2 Tax=Candidatus Methylobacter oryzae TaxID=2497749 RepID=A0ABY3CCN4_9GAMM|nr:hypothetical protein EKO24_006920 [Candidatus Methylobacter oryzae]
MRNFYIGQNIDVAKACRELDQCLLTDDELSAGRTYGKPTGISSLDGWLMSSLDRTVHAIGAGLLISLGLLSPWLKDKRLKRIVSNLIAVVGGVLLADALLHLLPNAIAEFIYGSHR